MYPRQTCGSASTSVAISFALLFAACNGGGVPLDNGNLGGTDMNPVAAGSDLSLGGPDLAMGPGMVMGTFAGMEFGTVLTGWFIGSQDSAETTVAYLFNRSVDCFDQTIRFDQMGWDANLPKNTQFLEMKLFGALPATTPPTMPGDYKITTKMAPIAGEASVNHSLTHGNAGSTESIANAGTITLKSIVDQKSAAGVFDLRFGSDKLTGSFLAGFCSAGVEP